jgi:hypothetical protein
LIEKCASLTVIKIDNDLVRNQLIIKQRIDQTVLIPSINEVIEFMRGGRNSTVFQIFTFHDNPQKGGFRYAFSSGGGEKQDPIMPWKGLPRMQTDTAAQIAYVALSLPSPLAPSDLTYNQQSRETKP